MSVSISFPSSCCLNLLPELRPLLPSSPSSFFLPFPHTGFPNFSHLCTKVIICEVCKYRLHYYLLNISFKSTKFKKKSLLKDISTDFREGGSRGERKSEREKHQCEKHQLTVFCMLPIEI